MEISSLALPEFLKDPKNLESPVFLFYGDDLLCREALGSVADLLVPKERRSLNQEVFDGVSDPTGRVMESLFTLPLFPAPKVVIWRETRILASKKETAAFLDKAREAQAAGEAKKAASYLLEYLALSGLGLADVDPADPMTAFPAEKRGAWITEILDFCREAGLAAAPFTDDSDLLADALEKGVPENHHLLVTAPVADKRKRLYKVMAEKGVAVDCSLPAGNRAADKNAQREILWERSLRVLAPLGKSLDRAAFDLVLDRIGADAAAFATALEKLAAHAGDRPKITVADVRYQVSRTRSDPVYEFTNAVFAREPGRAVDLLGRLLDGDFSAIGAVAALAGQARRLLSVKAFLRSPHGVAWKKGMDSRAFEREVLPAVSAYDEYLAGVCEWLKQDGPDEGEEAGPGPKGRKKTAAPKKTATETDLFLAKKGTHPFVVFKSFETASRFSETELEEALSLLLEADRRLKSTGQNPRLVTEAAALAICLGRPGVRP